MIRNKFRFFLPACAATLSLAGCSLSPQLTGGASGTEVSASVVTGSVVDPNGNPLSGAKVRLRPANFLSDSLTVTVYLDSHSVIDTTTATDGSFLMERVLPDSYSVEVMVYDTLSIVISFRNSGDKNEIRLPPDTARPMAVVMGNVTVQDCDSVRSFVQTYGLDRSVRPDSSGFFFMRMPCGNHRIHISAYSPDSPGAGELDGMDVSFGVSSGEYKNIGDMHLQPTQPPPCGDFFCDSMTVRKILNDIGLPGLAVDSAIVVQNGRVTGLVLRGRTIPNKFPWDILRLTEMRVLDLGQTGIPSVFPDIGKLAKLEILRLDGNTLTRVPSSIGFLQQLKDLNLSNNNLDSLPASIVKVRPAVFCDLSNNRLCTVDSARTVWANTYDPDWKATQRCP